MIHVQIASEVTTDGVRGMRWVLLEAAEPLPPEAEPPAAAAGAVTADTPAARGSPASAVASVAVEPPAAPASDAVADSLRLQALKLLVVALGLGAALWTAAVQIGPPGRRAPAAPAPASAALPPAPGAATQPMPTLPRQLPAAPATPAASATPPSTLDSPASAPAAAIAAPPAPPGAPASAGLPRLTASL